MNTKDTGYQIKKYDKPVKRYCQTLNLKDSPELIKEYIKRHSRTQHWPEINAGIKEVGILEMEIYILETHLFMIVETPLDFEWESAMKKLETLPRQAEWEEYMSIFQISEHKKATSSQKWKLMDRMFQLY